MCGLTYDQLCLQAYIFGNPEDRTAFYSYKLKFNPIQVRKANDTGSTLLFRTVQATHSIDLAVCHCNNTYGVWLSPLAGESLTLAPSLCCDGGVVASLAQPRAQT